MKNLKKLSLALMLATLFSTSFTSCIDNNVSPLVEAIYAAQADLIAAQAAVQNAEAALRTARANAEDARATLLEAQAAEHQANADATAAESAADQLRWAEELATLTENNDISVAWYQAKLDAAQAQFDVDIAELLEELAEMAALAAIDYAEAYAHHTDEANDIFQDVLEAQADLAIAELMLTDDPTPVSVAYAIAQLEGDVAMYTAAKEALEDAVADMEAAMADPNSLPNILQALYDDWDMYEAAEDANDIAQQEKFNEIMEVYEENEVREDFIDRYEDTLDEHDDAVSEKEDREDWIEAAQEDIAVWEDELADWAAAKLGYQDAVAAAELAISDAETALGVEDANGDPVVWNLYYGVDAAGDPIAAGGVKYAAPANLQETYVNTRIDLLDAVAAWTIVDDELTALEADIASLEASLNAAAAALNAQQLLVDGGGAAAAVAAASADVLTAEANLALADAAYQLWRDRFEGGPTVNGGFWYEDLDTGVVLADDILGNVDDSEPVNVEAFVEVLTWTYVDLGAPGPSGADYYEPLTVDPTLVSSIDNVTQIELIGGGAGTVPFPDFLSASPNVGFTETYYIEVGLDDDWYDNLAEHNAATTALGNEDIFDVPPMAGDSFLGDGSLGGDDAYTDLWDAQLVELDALAAEATQLSDLADLQAEFDRLQAIFENELALLDAAQMAADDAAVIVADATTLDDAAHLATADAWTAIGMDQPEGMAGDPLVDPVNTLNEALHNAEIMLADFCARTEEDIQDDIDDANDDIAEWTLEISQIQPIIDAKLAIVLAMQAEYDELILNEGELSSLAADLHAQIIALWQEHWALEAEEDALEFHQDLIEDLIDEYEDEYDAEDLEFAYDDLMDDLQDACDGLAEAEAALATAQADQDAAEAYLAYLQSLIDTLLAQHANELALADEYKALMEAALAS